MATPRVRAPLALFPVSFHLGLINAAVIIT